MAKRTPPLESQANKIYVGSNRVKANFCVNIGWLRVNLVLVWSYETAWTEGSSVLLCFGRCKSCINWNSQNNAWPMHTQKLPNYKGLIIRNHQWTGFGSMGWTQKKCCFWCCSFYCYEMKSYYALCVKMWQNRWVAQSLSTLSKSWCWIENQIWHNFVCTFYTVYMYTIAY